MSDTPRTKELKDRVAAGLITPNNLFDEYEKIERELAEAKAKLDGVRLMLLNEGRELSYCLDKKATIEEERDSLRTQLEKAQAEYEKLRKDREIFFNLVCKFRTVCVGKISGTHSIWEESSQAIAAKDKP